MPSSNESCKKYDRGNAASATRCVNYTCSAQLGLPAVTDMDLTNVSTAIVSRTLVTAGFSITNSRRQPTHIEVHCERADMFGCVVRYLVVVCDGDDPPTSDLPNIARTAEELRRTLLVVCKLGGPTWISWQDFLDSLGGAVPSWRALGPEYRTILLDSANNRVPSGLTGEAWQILEDAVADGFEFILGNRVNRLGGKKRGRRVSDMVTQTPDRHVLILDTKASAAPFDATWDELRPLVEYTKTQIARQRGQFEVRGAILVAHDFKQQVDSLTKFSGDFLAEAGVPLTFVRAQQLAGLVATLGKEPVLRSSVSWPRMLCRGGFLSQSHVDTELEAARSERYARGTPHSS